MLHGVGWHAFKFQLPGNNSGIGTCFHPFLVRISVAISWTLWETKCQTDSVLMFLHVLPRPLTLKLCTFSEHLLQWVYLLWNLWPQKPSVLEEPGAHSVHTELWPNLLILLVTLHQLRINPKITFPQPGMLQMFCDCSFQNTHWNW